MSIKQDIEEYKKWCTENGLNVNHYTSLILFLKEVKNSDKQTNQIV